MRIGVTGGIREWPIAAQLGYDYCEANFSWIASVDEDTFAQCRRVLNDCSIQAETFNGFFDPRVKLYETDSAWMREYACRTFNRAALLGGQIAVLGSGNARQVPEGMDKAEAEKKFAEILSICGDAAEAVGMRVVIEPLRRAECNFINTLPESVAMCRRVQHKAVGTLLDFFHFYANGETLDELPDAAPLLWHTHLARPRPDRYAPLPKDVDAIAPYAQALKQIGYTGRISLECAWAPDYKTAITNAFSVMDVFRNV